MGNPKKRRKTYSKPSHPWQKDRIEEERAYMKEYGLKNKKEIWKASSLLDSFRDRVKRFVSLSGEQVEKEKKQLMQKVHSLGLLSSTETDLNEVLELTTKDILERRLQTIVLKKGLARSIGQARQMITHNHIFVNDKKIDAPSYLVTIKEEAAIKFRPSSGFSDSEHPERNILKKGERQQMPKKPEPKKEDKLEEQKSEDSKEEIEESKEQAESKVEESKTEEKTEIAAEKSVEETEKVEEKTETEDKKSQEEKPEEKDKKE